MSRTFVTEKAPKSHQYGTPSFANRHTLGHMKGAFVVRLGPGTRPSENHFEGWVEEVDSGKEVKFHSLDELVKFFGEGFQLGFGERNRLGRDNP